MTNELPQPIPLDEQPKRANSLLDSDFVESQPAPVAQPKRSAEVDEFAANLRAGLEQLGFDPSQMSQESYAAFEQIVFEQHQAMLQAKAAQQFLLNHSGDYLPCPENEHVMREALDAHGFNAADARELEVVFNTLAAQGKIVRPQRTGPQSLGLFESQSTRQVQQEPMTEEEFRRKLDSMPLEDARRFMREHMRQQQ